MENGFKNYIIVIFVISVVSVLSAVGIAFIMKNNFGINMNPFTKSEWVSIIIVNLAVVVLYDNLRMIWSGQN